VTGTMHVADHQGDTTHTWDTTDPTTVREIGELFRQAQATGRLVYRHTQDGTGEQVRLDTCNPLEHTELFVARGWLAASAFGDERSDLVAGPGAAAMESALPSGNAGRHSGGPALTHTE
jgi:hypothetical protein